MRLRDDFVWEVDVVVAGGAAQVWLLALADDGSKKFGSMMDLEVQRATEAAGLWPPGATRSIASGATWATPVRVDACCTLQHSGSFPANPASGCR